MTNQQIKVEGKHGISATILAHSISPQGIQMLSYELEKPRIILAEENTHRMLSKNSASSRAIPFNKMQEQLTARPVRFGQANPGMQDKGVDYDAPVTICDYFAGDWINDVSIQEAWDLGRKSAEMLSQAIYEAGYHKQIYNRLVEPFQMVKTVMSGTEWANFFWLRNDGAADPTIEELAKVMHAAREQSVPRLLLPGQWHLPYIDWIINEVTGDVMWLNEIGTYEPTTWEILRKISAARSAAVSFRNTDYTMQKSLEVYERLVGDERKHSSAFEHQATPMQEANYNSGDAVNFPRLFFSWEEGVTHSDRQGQLWSGNLRGWRQFRKLIEGENVAGY